MRHGNINAVYFENVDGFDTVKIVKQYNSPLVEILSGPRYIFWQFNSYRRILKTGPLNA